jgi:hypothetical protein
MSPHSSPAADRIVNALHAIFGQRLRSVVAYGPHVENGGADVAEPLSCLALVANLTIADLEASAARAHEWTRHQIATPLLLPEDEFRRSLDAFPLEYGEILRAHQVLFGANPFRRHFDRARGPATRVRNADQEPPGASSRGLHRSCRHAARRRRYRDRVCPRIRRAAAQYRSSERFVEKDRAAATAKGRAPRSWPTPL